MVNIGHTFLRPEPILVPNAARLSDPLAPWHKEMTVPETHDLVGLIRGRFTGTENSSYA